jgi:hypothetical protein
LLLWGMSQLQAAEVQKAISAAIHNGLLKKIPPTTLEDWVLHEYLEVAVTTRLITEETRNQGRIAKDFRNLIHPGRAVKKAATCDRGTALAANAAVELVARDLQMRFPCPP